jgi:hypothetical protein
LFLAQEKTKVLVSQQTDPKLARKGWTLSSNPKIEKSNLEDSKSPQHFREQWAKASYAKETEKFRYNPQDHNMRCKKLENEIPYGPETKKTRMSDNFFASFDDPMDVSETKVAAAEEKESREVAAADNAAKRLTLHQHQRFEELRKTIEGTMIAEGTILLFGFGFDSSWRDFLFYSVWIPKLEPWELVLGNQRMVQ